MGMYGWALIKPQIMRKFNWQGSSKGGGKYATLPRGGEGGAGAAAHAEHEDVFDHEQPILPSPPRPPLQPPQPSMMRAQPPPRASLLPSYQPAAHHPPTPQQQQWVSATSLPPYPMPAVAAVPPPIAPHQIMPPLEAVPSLGERYCGICGWDGGRVAAGSEGEGGYLCENPGGPTKNGNLE